MDCFANIQRYLGTEVEAARSSRNAAKRLPHLVEEEGSTFSDVSVSTSGRPRQQLFSRISVTTLDVGNVRGGPHATKDYFSQQFVLTCSLLTFRIQRRNCRVQEHFIHCLGCRRTGQDPTPLEALCVFFLHFLFSLFPFPRFIANSTSHYRLPEHPGNHLCRRFERSRACVRSTRRTSKNAQRGRTP